MFNLFTYILRTMYRKSCICPKVKIVSHEKQRAQHKYQFYNKTHFYMNASYKEYTHCFCFSFNGAGMHRTRILGFSEVSSSSGTVIFSQAIKEDVMVGYRKFMDNRINDSQIEGLETFETKLTLFGKYPNPNLSSGLIHS
jgi:hypothetical protein